MSLRFANTEGFKGVARVARRGVVALLAIGLAAPALADPGTSRSALPGLAGGGIGDVRAGAGAGAGAPLSGAEVEAQLREIENTKRLMKALGEMHGGAPAKDGPGPGAGAAGAQASAAAGLQTPAAPGAPQPPVQARAVEPAPSIPGVPTTELREAVGAASQVARAAGITSDRSQSRSVDPAERAAAARDAQEAAPRASVPHDETRLRQLISDLIDEVWPWMLAFVIVFGLGYATITWAAGRAGAMAGSSRGSRRGRRRGRNAAVRHHPSADGRPGDGERARSR